MKETNLNASVKQQLDSYINSHPEANLGSYDIVGQGDGLRINFKTDTQPVNILFKSGKFEPQGSLSGLNFQAYNDMITELNGTHKGTLSKGGQNDELAGTVSR